MPKTKKKVSKKKIAKKAVEKVEEKAPETQQKQASTSSLKKHLYLTTIITLILGIIIGVIITGTTLKTTPSLVQTSCEIDIEALYGKSCEITEECYGRLELCSASLKKCITTVLVDKTDLRNIRIPNTKQECEANGGFWKVELIPQE